MEKKPRVFGPHAERPLVPSPLLKLFLVVFSGEIRSRRRLQTVLLVHGGSSSNQTPEAV